MRRVMCEDNPVGVRQVIAVLPPNYRVWIDEYEPERGPGFDWRMIAEANPSANVPVQITAVAGRMAMRALHEYTKGEL